MTLVETTEALIDELFADLREEDQTVLTRMGGVDSAKAAALKMTKMFTSQVFVTDDGRAAALWIAVQKWPGLVEIVCYSGNAVEDEKVGFYRACVRGIGYMKDVMDLHKIECTVWGDYSRSKLWLMRLGFEQEGYMKQHGPDKTDATMMGRCF